MESGQTSSQLLSGIPSSIIENERLQILPAFLRRVSRLLETHEEVLDVAHIEQRLEVLELLVYQINVKKSFLQHTPG